jgi:monoamine oxidase
MVIIIGAGLSGLLTAYRLKKEGIPFKILEARTRVGGRINTIYGTGHAPVEMGATWFGNHHKQLIALLDELEINYFEQYMEGRSFFQPYSNAAANAIQIPSQPPNYRIAGGTSKLINTLCQQFDEDELILNQSVKEIRCHENGVQVIAKAVFEANTVILAIPPKLWANNILFEPQLPSDLMTVARQTHTWMEDSIKVALTYKQPFWQQENRSGALFSNAGPVTELYDHCNHKRSKYALCGFINDSFKTLTYEKRRASVINQLKTVFGAQAEAFMDYEECIWSKEENTFEASITALYPHQNNGNPIFNEALYSGRLLISSSESASEFPGYMDGAVSSANMTAKKIITSNSA